MPPKCAAKKTSEEKGKFIWTDDEAQLLLDVEHDYKSQASIWGYLLGVRQVKIF